MDSDSDHSDSDHSDFYLYKKPKKKGTELQKKLKGTEDEASKAITALKVGAVVAGVALLGLGAWSLLSSPSNSNDPEQSKKKKKGTEHESSAVCSGLKVGAAVALTAFQAVDAFNSLSSLLSEITEAQAVGAKNRFNHAGVQQGSYCGDYAYRGSAFRLVRIMSYNVRFFEDEGVFKRMRAMGQLIQKHSPDVILFQEVTTMIYRLFQSSEWWELYECFLPQDRETDTPFCFQLSKLPLETIIKMSFDRSAGREVRAAKLKVGSNGSLVVVSNHGKNPNISEKNCANRQAQAIEVLSHLKHYPNVVFGGEMNWDVDSDGKFPLQGSWFDPLAQARRTESGLLRGYRPNQKRSDKFVCKLSDFKVNGIEMIGMEDIPETSYSHKKKENFGLLLTLSNM